MTIAIPTRAEGLARLDAFAPHMGRAYADRRNHDAGPDGAATVSVLSRYVRHRLIEERELIDAALTHHGPERADKWISEVLWRGYFKGWLEQRPSVWRAYLHDRDAALADLARGGTHAAGYAQAIAGRTGIDCFDAWIGELVARNWLHNHARMWFASIWIFTLRLPWQLGADLFLRHLIDGDPASNTLSWRWVAGLHTRGKTYLARADNIARHTGGRFSPRGLADHAAPLVEQVDHPLVPLAPPPPPALPGRYALLIHDDDCRAESLALAHPPARVIGLSAADGRSAGTADTVTGFADGAVDDALARASAAFGCSPCRVASAGEVAAAAAAHDLDTVVATHAPVGPVRDALADAGIAMLPPRDYDGALWPLATAGFFRVRAGAPDALRPIGLAL
ncbi:FAD-binding domain-containing protein [Sphingomonas sp. SFZ2018-12]|uniref:FAD-binding domain-containing protein n=1 Tax=Sphingomonas sp. SFZ2018-12 TaxID=2683197 RepID=UPI001F0F3C0A